MVVTLFIVEKANAQPQPQHALPIHSVTAGKIVYFNFRIENDSHIYHTATNSTQTTYYTVIIKHSLLNKRLDNSSDRGLFSQVPPEHNANGNLIFKKSLEKWEDGDVYELIVSKWDSIGIFNFSDVSSVVLLTPSFITDNTQPALNKVSALYFTTPNNLLTNQNLLVNHTSNQFEVSKFNRYLQKLRDYSAQNSTNDFGISQEFLFFRSDLRLGKWTTKIVKTLEGVAMIV